ncbi:MAG: hypothetical protein ACF8QF_11230 [Phycisphaerales bacterium]
MPKRAFPILAAILLAATGCASSRPTYTEAPAPPAPAEVTVIIFQPICTAWHVHAPPAPEACAARCCVQAREVKPRWFE